MILNLLIKDDIELIKSVKQKINEEGNKINKILVEYLNENKYKMEKCCFCFEKNNTIYCNHQHFYVLKLFYKN